MIPLFGAISDRNLRQPVYLAGALLNVMLAFPVFWLVYTDRQSLIWLGLVGVIALGHSAMYGPQAAFFAELFPTQLRATGISFVHQIGALIGSVGGLAAAWLLAGYVVFVGLVTLGCTLLFPETAPRASGVRLSGQPAPPSY